MSKLLLFFLNNDVKYHIINCIQFSKEKAELEGVPEAEALPEALTFYWKRKRRKRKSLGWKRKC
jgi:hypothetical protein